MYCLFSIPVDRVVVFSATVCYFILISLFAFYGSLVFPALHFHLFTAFFIALVGQCLLIWKGVDAQLIGVERSVNVV